MSRKVYNHQSIECLQDDSWNFGMSHVLKMKGLIDQLDKLGAPISHELDTDLILGSLPES